MRFISLLLFSLLFLSCNQKDSDKNKLTDNQSLIEEEKTSFFPVNDFIKGQIANLKTTGKSAFKKITTDAKVDSNWVKYDSLELEFNDFVQPPIDSIQISRFFSEHKFIDETINALTMVYEPIGQTPDSIPWRNWMIYIDPASGKVQKIYLVKDIGNNRIQQLTWMTDKYCKIVTINEYPEKDKKPIENELLIRWDY